MNDRVDIKSRSSNRFRTFPSCKSRNANRGEIICFQTPCEDTLSSYWIVLPSVRSTCAGKLKLLLWMIWWILLHHLCVWVFFFSSLPLAADKKYLSCLPSLSRSFELNFSRCPNRRIFFFFKNYGKPFALFGAEGKIAKTASGSKIIFFFSSLLLRKKSSSLLDFFLLAWHDIL